MHSCAIPTLACIPAVWRTFRSTRRRKSSKFGQLRSFLAATIQGLVRCVCGATFGTPTRYCPLGTKHPSCCWLLLETGIVGGWINFAPSFTYATWISHQNGRNSYGIMPRTTRAILPSKFIPSLPPPLSQMRVYSRLSTLVIRAQCSISQASSYKAPWFLRSSYCFVCYCHCSQGC
ncbi:hypothetical protein GQ54DRAFT_147108 [Martensiomyces pterosporus]|nr:hypothetical protein GQ54DRAFT_147108 [Martensiomyces pterosporus]